MPHTTPPRRSYLRRRYDDLVRQVPLMAVHNAGRSSVPSDIYTPPPLRAGGAGWHPEVRGGVGAFWSRSLADPEHVCTCARAACACQGLRSSPCSWQDCCSLTLTCHVPFPPACSGARCGSTGASAATRSEISSVRLPNLMTRLPPGSAAWPRLGRLAAMPAVTCAHNFRPAPHEAPAGWMAASAPLTSIPDLLAEAPLIFEGQSLP